MNLFRGIRAIAKLSKEADLWTINGADCMRQHNSKDRHLLRWFWILDSGGLLSPYTIHHTYTIPAR